MSQQTVAGIDSRVSPASEIKITLRRRTRSVGQVLSVMTFAERVRAYKSGVFTRSELAAAIASEPECLPTINGEFEWIGASLADNLD